MTDITAPEETARIAAFLADCTVEVTPRGAARIEDFRAVLPAGSKVYVTFLPGSDFAETLATVRRLREEGMEPVPHIAARSVPSAALLESWLKSLQREGGIREALLVGGGVSRPAGPFASSMEVLETGLLEAHGVRRLGVAGHPEGSPDIPETEIAAALAAKNAYARQSGLDMYIVTQFCFESAPVLAWERRLRQEGNRLPVRIGLPGLATIGTLLKHAQACGVGPSIRVLTRQAASLARLMTVRQPDLLLRDLALAAVRDPDCLVRGCHLYPLGGLRRSVDWMQAVQRGDFRMDRHGHFIFPGPPDGT